MPSLYVIRGNGQGSHFDLTELVSSSDDRVIGIGREKGNDITAPNNVAKVVIEIGLNFFNLL